MKIGNDISYEEQYADHRADFCHHGMDHERDLQSTGRIIWNSESWSLYYYFQYSDLSVHDSSADQTAEVLKADFCYAAGASEDPEKISG